MVHLIILVTSFDVCISVNFKLLLLWKCTSLTVCLFIVYFLHEEVTSDAARQAAVGEGGLLLEEAEE